jgi:transcription termination factor Rho
MNFEEYTLVELRQLAKEKGIKNVSKLKKEELIELLSDISVQNIENKVVKEENIQEPANETVKDTTGGYKITNEEDTIVEGILEVLPDGYRFFKRGELSI